VADEEQEQGESGPTLIRDIADLGRERAGGRWLNRAGATETSSGLGLERGSRQRPVVDCRIGEAPRF